jgi:hypothetical protein
VWSEQAVRERTTAGGSKLLFEELNKNQQANSMIRKNRETMESKELKH